MAIKPVIASKTVTTAGTRVQFTTTDIDAVSMYMEALGTNTGFIYIGDVTVSSTVYMARLEAGQGFTWTAPAAAGSGRATSGALAVNSIYFDSSVSGEKVLVSYHERLGSL